jgi:CRISPR-associated endonuclease/helicase Cas3
VAIKEDDPETIDNRQKTTYRWDEVVTSDELSTALMVVLPRQLASYYDDLGFVLHDGRLKIRPSDYPSDYQSTKRIVDKSKHWGGSRQQSYQEHIQGLVRAYNHNIRNDIYHVANKLEQEMGLSNGTIDQAIRLAIACHDLGKLDRTWQQWAREWQNHLMEQQNRPYQSPDQHFFFAKTTFDYSSEQRELQKKIQTKRPHHACESVMLGMRLIAASLGLVNNQIKGQLSVLRAICGAIARHHTTQASQFGTANLDEEARKVAGEAIVLAKQDLQWSYNLSLLDLIISKDGDLASASTSTTRLTKPESGPTSELETWLYFIIVRALRLADQRADIQF